MTNKHPKLIASEHPDLIDEAEQVYGVGDASGWPDVDDACEQSPSGHHVFSCGPGADPEICIHCKQRA